MVFLNKNAIIIINISLLLIQIKTSYILLPFIKRDKLSEPDDASFTPENFSQFYIEPKYVSIIEVGTPPQKVELIYSADNYGISMVEDKNSTIINYFNKNLSSTISIIHSFDSKFSYSSRPITLQETMFFPFEDTTLNQKSKIKVEEYPFVYLTKKGGIEMYENKEFIKEENGKSYMIFGGKVYCNWKNEICESFPYYLKHKRIINSYNFNVLFNKENGNEEYDFALRIGDEPHEVSPDIYDKGSLKYTNALSYVGETNWIIQFDEVYYFPEGFKLNINTNSDDLNQISIDESLNDKKAYSYKDRGQMVFDLDIILCPKFYYFTINKTFFGNHTKQCEIIHTKYKYAIFVCDKNFNTENFPPIYFYHKELNHTFILTENELFRIKGNKKYFLLVYDLYRPHFWMFGKIFLKKYLFNYDMENKRLGFYAKRNNVDQINNTISNTSQNILLINLIWIGVVIIIGISAFFLGKLLCNKMRKKRANELDDDYDYTINEENVEKGINDQDQIRNINEESKNNKLID